MATRNIHQEEFKYRLAERMLKYKDHKGELIFKPTWMGVGSEHRNPTRAELKPFLFWVKNIEKPNSCGHMHTGDQIQHFEQTNELANGNIYSIDYLGKQGEPEFVERLDEKCLEQSLDILKARKSLTEQNGVYVPDEEYQKEVEKIENDLTTHPTASYAFSNKGINKNKDLLIEVGKKRKERKRASKVKAKA